VNTDGAKSIAGLHENAKEACGGFSLSLGAALPQKAVLAVAAGLHPENSAEMR